MKTLLGIDEAGRGSVIGPMVIAGAMIDEKDEKLLKQIGVKDSKLLTKEKREIFYDQIIKIVKDYVIIKITAKEIDETRKRINLNKIEAEKIAEIVKAMKADTAIIDTPQVSTDKFKALVYAQSKTSTKLICENKADMNHPVCAAASILAKVERDREVEKIKKIIGYDIGVGYPHDERSIAWIRENLDGKYKHFIRHSWVTVSDIKAEKEQRGLKDF